MYTAVREPESGDAWTFALFAAGHQKGEMVGGGKGGWDTGDDARCAKIVLGNEQLAILEW